MTEFVERLSPPVARLPTDGQAGTPVAVPPTGRRRARPWDCGGYRRTGRPARLSPSLQMDAGEPAAGTAAATDGRAGRHACRRPSYWTPASPALGLRRLPTDGQAGTPVTVPPTGRRRARRWDCGGYRRTGRQARLSPSLQLDAGEPAAGTAAATCGGYRGRIRRRVASAAKAFRIFGCRDGWGRELGLRFGRRGGRVDGLGRVCFRP